MAQDAKEAVRNASALVAQAIQELVEVGPDAPASVREALSPLGSAFQLLGWADPNVSYSIPRDAAPPQDGKPA